MPAPLSREAFKPHRSDPCFCNSGQRFKSCCGSLSVKRPPPHGLHIVESFLDPDCCADWVQLFEQQQREFVSIVDHHRSTPGNTVLRRDDSRVTERVDAGPLKAKVEEVIKQAVTRELSVASQRKFSWFIGPQVLRYQAGGHYALHADSDHWSPQKGEWLKGLDRDLSLLLYLNSDFSGGELGFPLFNYTYRPRAGDLLFFPSDFRYRHQAYPVTQGVRYVIVSWAAFTEQVRVQDLRPENRIDLD